LDNIETRKDGSRYEGDFVDGVRHGHGFYSYSKYDKYKRDYYDGEWKNGLKSGFLRFSYEHS
jgi:hypothetical protein